MTKIPKSQLLLGGGPLGLPGAPLRPGPQDRCLKSPGQGPRAPWACPAPGASVSEHPTAPLRADYPHCPSLRLILSAKIMPPKTQQSDPNLEKLVRMRGNGRANFVGAEFVSRSVPRTVKSINTGVCESDDEYNTRSNASDFRHALFDNASWPEPIEIEEHSEVDELMARSREEPNLGFEFEGVRS
ncbi:hypothetical protein CROQUDRAFT_98089 [Cronartium quercuum f. sp. fusiforme G11]|uniref:Uncharacterized protein n=1 Tax=Cronartium quercuum f. sp. fusiforme G11 TaxID=708437 RepID=A0A9P6T7I6_9BASI|nr:hypothetical protein CROQUDRAFT_98089 [Cronartium quercuum f. sp. fusiforme G11]